jgi:LysR family pca operon transcriptional activator
VKRHLRQHLKFRHLRVVDAILGHGSILQAANALGVSQPALTKSLHEIEEIVGARLFERHSRGVTPNPYGLAVGEAARRLMLEASRLEDALDVIDGGDGGPIVVGALPVAAAGLLPGALARFQADHPEIEVQVQQARAEPLLSALARRDVDFVVGRLSEPAEPDGYVREPLYDEALAILARAGHPALRAGAATVHDLAAYPLVLPSVSQLVGQEIDAFLQQLGLEPRQPLRTGSLALIRESLLATDRIAVMPKVMLAGDLLRGVVRAAPTPVAPPPRPAGLVRRSETPLPRSAAALVAALRAYAAEVQARIG